LGCAFRADAALTSGASFSNASACAVKPANRNHAGAHSRASQSVAIHARVSSSRLLDAVPITFGISGFNICRS
jgi:hypothetical protein